MYNYFLVQRGKDPRCARLVSVPVRRAAGSAGRGAGLRRQQYPHRGHRGRHHPPVQVFSQHNQAAQHGQRTYVSRAVMLIRIRIILGPWIRIQRFKITDKIKRKKEFNQRKSVFSQEIIFYKSEP